MKIILISIFKFLLRLVYAPMKLFTKTQNTVVFLSRQSNEKSIDMELLSDALAKQCPNTKQIFRLKMIDDGIKAKILYFFHILGDMRCLAIAKVAIVDTYSIPVSVLKHKENLKIIQMWHALGAVKKFGLQSLGTKEGRDEKVSNSMMMHKNYDFVLAPSKATGKYYTEAFGVGAGKIRICPLPRVDYILGDKSETVKSFFTDNPTIADKKMVLYLPTFRDREAYVAEELKVQFEDQFDYHLIVSAHPLSKIKKDPKFSFNGNYTTYQLMKIADIIITDYSACSFEASLLMKPLYFFVPDYDLYVNDRGLNTDIKKEMSSAVFESAEELLCAIKSGEYDYDMLYSFKTKYTENANTNNAEILAKFVSSLL